LTELLTGYRYMTAMTTQMTTMPTDMMNSCIFFVVYFACSQCK